MEYPRSDHYDGKRFFNPRGPGTKSALAILRWVLQGGKVQWPETRANTATPNLAPPTLPGIISSTFINHATQLLQTRRYRILTDPVFSDRVSPLKNFGPKRVRNPAIKLPDLPQLDVVLLSHNHYDHLDAEATREIAAKFNPLYITPLGNGEILRRLGVKRIIELDWWQAAELPDHPGLEIHLTPAQHWSKRTAFDTNCALWGGFVGISEGARFYFAGDTGYGDFFKKIYERFGAMDLSILPIGAYEPRWFMRDQHMNPEEAVLAHLDLRSRLSLGTHFGTFQLTNEGIDEPVVALKAAMRARRMSEKDFQAPETGETIFTQAPK